MTAEPAGPIVLAGAGKMGLALLAGWLRNGIEPSRILVQEPAPSAEAFALFSTHGIRYTGEIPALEVPPAVIVVAVKPQVLDDVFAGLAALAGAETVVMSIAAGKPIAAFEKRLARGSAVVRAMPNTPAAIGRGITGVVANAHVTSPQRELCERLLSSVGEVVWIDEEGLIDAVTAVSGSGPAYVFLLTEVLAKAGISAGLDETTAMRLARATVSGAGELLRQSGTEPEVLRKNVTSPGGTTAAALDVLMREKGGLQELLTEAVLQARQRGRELGK
jgi:pyrroline-5-carboxylate reductase